MKTLPAVLLALGLLSAALTAADKPSKDPETVFNARVGYAAIHGKPGIFTSKETGMTCELFTVNHGPDDDSSGYTLVIAIGPRDEFYIGKIIVLCDKTSIDPKTGVLCTGHVIVRQHDIFFTPDKDTPFLLGLEDAIFKYTPPSKNTNPRASPAVHGK